jgi:general secretion pathway protein F
MVLTGFSVVTFLLIFVIPRVVKIFHQANRDLPWPTQVLISGSNFLSSYFIFLVLGIVALAAGWVFWIRTEKGRWFLDNLKLRIPLFGTLYRMQAVARFGRTLGVLLASGLPILDSLSISKLVIANRVMESSVETARDETRRGGMFSAALEQSGQFPPVFTDMVSVGEQSGRMDDMLLHVASHLEQESESTIQTMLSLVDPILILVMGLIVGFVVVAILLPLFEISQLVR